MFVLVICGIIFFIGCCVLYILGLGQDYISGTHQAQIVKKILENERPFDSLKSNNKNNKKNKR